MILIGGSNVDFTAVSVSPLIRHDSNIGKLKVSFGGVMRNAAENLARLHERVFFVTALGNDAYGREIKEQLESLGATVLTPEISPDLPTPSYLAIIDSDSDMDVAVCDAQLIESLAPSDIDAFDEYIRNEDLIALDCNLSEETIAYISEKYKDKKIAVEAVSANKVVRLRGHLEGIYLLKCNVLEARYLLEDETISPEAAALKLHDMGVENIVISHSAEPVTVFENGEISHVETCRSQHPVSYSGCGDALFAGIIKKVNENRSLKEAVLYGSRLAAYTSETVGSCNPDIASFYTEK